MAIENKAEVLFKYLLEPILIIVVLMANGKAVSLQVVIKKLENIEERLQRIEKKQFIPAVRLSDREMKELDRIEKEMKAGKWKSVNEVFGE